MNSDVQATAMTFKYYYRCDLCGYMKAAHEQTATHNADEYALPMVGYSI